MVYFWISQICLSLGAIILGLFENDSFIRGFTGDFIIVILIFSFIKLLFNFRSLQVAVFTLALAYLTELLQYFRLISYLGLEDNPVARIIIGATFDPLDLVAYTLGVMVIYLMDQLIIGNKKSPDGCLSGKK
jgi:hypothetical protein